MTITSTTGKTVKLETDTTEIIIDNIAEYVCGFGFMYFRLFDGRTLSVSRDNILTASRKLPTGDFRQIHLKKIKAHQSIDALEGSADYDC